MADFYALLIGIDYYQDNPHFESLQGAVRDIDKVGDYLEKSLKMPATKITRLTSPLPNTNSLAEVRAVRHEILPTYRNIINAFKSVTNTAKRGDLIYVHYSGHGGRVKTIFPDLKGGQSDEGLVPMDLGCNGYYLRDVEMTTLLKQMTDKGLFVTVIFDSCHSGGATRGDGQIRGSRDGKIDVETRPQDSLVADRETLAKNWLALTQDRGRDGWLPDRENLVFLGACRPSEFAYESTFGTGEERNGALTYWIIDTLNSNPTGLTYQALYDRVKGQIQSKFPNQLPMLLGKGDRLVFGTDIKPVRYSLTAIDVSVDRVTLDAGLAQGLSRGTRFALYPVGSNFSDKQQRLAVVEINNIEASRSTAKILSVAESGVGAAIEKLEPGLPAVMESAPIELQYSVRFYEKAVGDRENELPAEMAAKQAAALAQVRQAMQVNGFVREIRDDGESARYQVAITRNGEYEINQNTPIKNLTPALKIDDRDAGAEAVKRLVHLAKYQTIEALDNPESQLEIDFQLLDANKKPFDDRRPILLKSGKVYLRIENKSDRPLNIAILDLEATWEICLIPIKGQETAFYELAEREVLEISMDFQVPEGDDYQNKTEKLKLFATKGIANFKWLKLPALDRDMGKRGNLNRELEQRTQQRGAMGGGKLEISPLNHLLSQIGADADEPVETTRAFRAEPTPNADWIAKTIEIGF